MLPIEISKARSRDLPLKLTFKLKFTDMKTYRGSPAAERLAACEVKGDTVTIPLVQGMTNLSSPASLASIQYALVDGLVAYLLDPLPVHPIIRSGLGTILAGAAFVPDGQEVPHDKTTAAQRRRIRNDERAAEILARQMPKDHGEEIQPPRQRVYSFTNPRTAFLHLDSVNPSSFRHAITSALKELAPDGKTQVDGRGNGHAAQANFLHALITCYFLFGDNGGDPVYLRNYFESLEWFGTDQLARARLLHGRNPIGLCDNIIEAVLGNRIQLTRLMCALGGLLVLSAAPLEAREYTKIIVMLGGEEALGSPLASETRMTEVPLGTHPAEMWKQVPFAFAGKHSHSISSGTCDAHIPLPNPNDPLIEPRSWWQTLTRQPTCDPQRDHWGAEIGLGRDLYDRGHRDIRIVKYTRNGGIPDETFRAFLKDLLAYTAFDRTSFDHHAFEVIALVYFQKRVPGPRDWNGKDSPVGIYRNLRSMLPQTRHMKLFVVTHPLKGVRDPELIFQVNRSNRSVEPNS